MRSTQIIFILAVLIFIQGCALFEWKYSNELIENITADPKAESFSAILYRDTFNMVNEMMYAKKLIQIDSVGRITIIAELDTSKRMFYEKFLNDSLILNESHEDSSIGILNIKTFKQSILLKGYLFESLSNNGKYLAAVSSNYANRSLWFYLLEGDQLKLTGTTSQFFRRASPVGEDMFIVGKQNGNKRAINEIIKPDLTIFDSNIDGNLLFKPGAEKMKTLYMTFPMALNNYQPIVAKYDLITRHSDTLFTGLHYSNVIAIPSSDNYLLEGMTNEEYDDEERIIEKGVSAMRKKPGVLCVIPESPQGYWLIGNSKTKQVKKIGYKEWRPVISSSGRHILFYKKDGNDYKMKVVSVKELVEQY